MKKAKRIASFLLALVLALSMTITAFATEGDSEPEAAANESYTITINNTAKNHTYEVYQIFTGDLYNGILSNIAWGTGVNADGQSALGDATAKAKTLIVGDDTGANAKNFAVEVSEYLGDVYRTISYNKDSAKPYSTTVDQAGYYLVKDKDESANNWQDPDAYTSYILEVVGDKTVNVKSSVPTVEKKVKENVKTVDVSDTNGRTTNYTLEDGYNDIADYNIGDSVPFKLIGTLPDNFDDYTTYKIVFHDTLSTGLDYEDIVSVKVVTGENSTSVSYGTNGYVTEYDKENHILKITFNNLKNLTSTTGDTIAVTKDSYIVVDYTATLNEDAKVGCQDGNVNKVVLEYSNNPYDSKDSGKTPEDKVVVLTYQLDITKVDGSDVSIKLQDAEFVLQSASGEHDGKYVIVSNGVVTGWSDTQSDANILKTDEKGLISIKGLDDGTYILTETKAPAGYNNLKYPLKLVIDSKTNNSQNWNGTDTTSGLSLKIYEVTESGDVFVDEKTASECAGIVSTQVENEQGLELPSTGGTGVKAIYTLGSILVLCATVLLITRRRLSMMN